MFRPSLALILALFLFVSPARGQDVHSVDVTGLVTGESATAGVAPDVAKEPEFRDTLEKVKFKDAPEFIQAQIKNLVNRCTIGTLTYDKVVIYEFVAQDRPETPHYILDYSAFRGHPMTLSCSHGVYPCRGEGCLLQVYTQIEEGNFTPSLRPYALSFHITDEVDENRMLPIIHVKQPKRSCQNFAGDNVEDCSVSFTWINNKFRYFGVTLEDEKDPQKLKEREDRFRQQLEDYKKDNPDAAVEDGAEGSDAEAPAEK